MNVYFHTDCGHIIEESYDSSFISEGGWNHYTHMYLSRCSQCDDPYPYIKPLDESVRVSVQEVAYRLLNMGHLIYIPPYKSEVKSIRVKNTEKKSLGAEINHKSVTEVNEYEHDTLLKIGK